MQSVRPEDDCRHLVLSIQASTNSASTKVVTPHLKRTRPAAKQTLERGHLQARVDVDA